MEEIVQDIQQHAKETVIKNVFNDERENETCKKVEACFQDLENPFTVLNSAYKQSKFFSDKWKVVEPVECVIGSRFDMRKNKKTGTYAQTVVQDKFMYVPILSTLESIFKSQHIADMLKPSETSDSRLRDICDGSLLKTHPLFSVEKHTVQIQLFFDEFEVANPLGSKRGIHKLGAIYFTLRNFSPKWNSLLANIHLCALFHAQDIKRYSFSTILAPIVRDIEVLERYGIDIPLYGGPVRGSVVQVTGDNLGLHSMFGLVESFSARYCCRFCLAEKDDFQTEFSEDSPKIVLRTKHSHTAHCQEMALNSSLPYVFGVKSSCLLNSLKYFHTAENFSVDVMHDVLEGVAQYEMKLLFVYFKEHFVTLEELNLRIQSFDYGFMERNNRPVAVNLGGESNDLGLNAIQSWCLLRNVPLMFGDLVSSTDLHWNLLLLLLQIVNIVFSPMFSQGLCVYLKHLIVDHHKLFKVVYAQKKLLPKHHFLVHYPRCIQKIGPVLHSWCMRYEGKHNFFKKQLKSFKNITKTLVKKHQNYMAYIWQSSTIFSRLDIGPEKMVSLAMVKGGSAIAIAMQVPISVQVMKVNWAKQNGFLYRPHLVICGKVQCEMPLFYLIDSVLIVHEKLLLLTLPLFTVCFQEHFHAYEVTRTKQDFVVFHVDSLHYPRPFDIQMSYIVNDTGLFVVPYCFL
ncbi:uncharacterized protein LOC130924402 [Corythoichthys intestinalis]|uniref:uncharacterized protein LOC130924402 n=1 Tax=Corythoichthys intestinalis TaxID=161448 RepID=UPI0025A5548D|nr:uncharacterized protein LOC130924402 [Corythoichthys intestinalis]